MISVIEDEFYKIIQPIIVQRSDLSNNCGDLIINIDQISLREKINLINNVKLFIKTNINNPGLSVVFSRLLQAIFTDILFRSLDDRDQNVRIVADETINCVARLSSSNSQYSPFLIYNLFIQIKNNYSPRSINGALRKFSAVSPLIKHSKRRSYADNVLPLLKVIVSRCQESTVSALVDSLPNIADALFPFSAAEAADLEAALVLPILRRQLTETRNVTLQRNLCQLLAIISVHLKDVKLYLSKLFQYSLSIINNDNDMEVTRCTLLLIKALITVCCHHRSAIIVDEIPLVVLHVTNTIENDSTPSSIKNIALDCLLQLLRLKDCNLLLDFLMSIKDVDTYREKLKLLNHELIFNFVDALENDESIVDVTELADVATVEEEDTLFIRCHSNEAFKVDIVDDGGDECRDLQETSFMDLPLENNVIKDVSDEVVVKKCLENKLGTLLGLDDTFMKYVIQLLILEFLPDCIDDLSPLSFLKERNIMVSSKVLAIQCLSQICLMDYSSVIVKLSVNKGSYELSSVLDSVLFYCNHEDSQLGGSAMLFVGQVISSQLSLNLNHKSDQSKQSNGVDHIQLIGRIQSSLDTPVSSQHLKLVLSAVKFFLWDLISSYDGSLAFKIIESVLHFADHNYKLVRREVISVCRCVDFRSISYLERDRRINGLQKNVSVAEQCRAVIFTLLSDVEIDVMEDACGAIKDLIDNGAFDDHYCRPNSCHLLSTDDSDSKDSPINQRKLIPFLSSDINITLWNLQRRLNKLSRYSPADCHTGIHRCLHVVTEKLISTPVPSGKEMKSALNNINGCVSVLMMLLEKFPLNNYTQLWIDQVNTVTSTTTKHLLSHCISLLNVPFITLHMHLHTDILHITSRLILHGGLEHLLKNDLLIEKPNSTFGIVLNLNVDLPLVVSLKLLMVHLCRMLNIFWHVFQFITPIIPPHKTVLPNLSSQTSMNPSKKKMDPVAYNKASTNTETQSYTDSRPPRSRSCLGFFVQHSHYMSIYKSITVAYNSYLISSDSANFSDKILSILSKCLESLSIILEVISFNEVSPYVEEFLAYCSVFYNVLPTETVKFIIKLLGSLFGTNITAQWDPFLSQVFSFIVTKNTKDTTIADISQLHVREWSRLSSVMGTRLQELLKNASINNQGIDSPNIERWDECISDTFQWIKTSGKRREPGILRQMVSTNINSRPSLSHYIGMFEKHVFQCMRQYLASPPELQISIIQLLCQLIYLRVNYCQLDSEQKFLNIIFNQLETFSTSNVEFEKKSSLIIEIMEFLILITYEKAGPTKRDQPILSLTQVINSVESLIVNEVNVTSVIIPCLWKIVCDLFVHRSVWLNHPGNFNLLPNANTSKEIGVQREAIIDLILRKLVSYPETLDILSVILEHSAREHEEKWEKLSFEVWSKVSFMLSKDQIKFCKPIHVDYLLRLIGFISSRVISNQSTNYVHNMMSKYDYMLLLESLPVSDIGSKYQDHILQSVRSVVSLHIITLYKLNFSQASAMSLTKVIDEFSSKKVLFNQMLDILLSMVQSYNVVVNTPHVRPEEGYRRIGVKLLRMLLVIMIDIKKSDRSSDQRDLRNEKPSQLVSTAMLSSMDHYFREIKESELDILSLWDELKYLCCIYQCSVTKIRSRVIQEMFSCNNISQMCRHLLEADKTDCDNIIRNLVSEYYIFIIALSEESYVQRMLDIIRLNGGLSIHFLEAFENNSNQIFQITSLSMKWLCIIEKLHLECSQFIIDILLHYVSNHHDIYFVVLMKIEAIFCSRISTISSTNSQIPFVLTTVSSLETMISESKLSFPQLSDKLREYRQYIPKSAIVKPLEVDPLDSIASDGIIDEKKYWRLCVEKSMLKNEQDCRLGPRLLQGGSVSDLEEIFQVTLESTESKSKRKSTLDTACDNKRLFNLPPKFIQQCLRLGFLRSGGGGIMQEGVRVDVIFRLGEKLMFQELALVVEVTKVCLMKEDYAILHNSSLVGLLTALNDYFRLSCQLSVPLPVSSVVINHLVQLIEHLCLLHIRTKNACSRILIEEVLVLMNSCFCPSTILTNEEMRILRRELHWSYIAVTVDFLYMIVEQYTQNKLFGVEIKSLSDNVSQDSNMKTLMKVHRIIKLCLQGILDVNGGGFQSKLQSAIFTIARLPSLVKFIRNPSNIKSLDIRNVESINYNYCTKDVVELDCLSKMNRDDLASAQTLFTKVGWTSRFMFEETWLIYLNLLHDKGPSAIISGTDESDAALTPEEVVEQGHCDSVGLLGVTNLLLMTTARPYPGNSNNAQLEHRPRDKTPNLLHTKIGKKLSTIHTQLDDEIFTSLRGFKMMLSGWIISSWNIEREDSVLQYRHDQINVNVLAKRISIGSRSPQISGADNTNLDVLSCLQSLPIIYGQWLQSEEYDVNKKSVALLPRAFALRSSVILMDLFSSREQLLWLFECLLELRKSINIEDDWITLSWLCIGLSKCVSVLETSSNATIPQNVGKSQIVISTNSIYGLLPTVKLIEICLNSDLTILQQSALHSAIFLLQMTVYGKASWDLPTGSLIELKSLHEMVISYLEGQLLSIDPPEFCATRRNSVVDVSNNQNSLSQTMSTGATNWANTVSDLTSINSMNPQLSLTYGVSTGSNAHSVQSTLPRLINGDKCLFIRSERHNHLIMATACFYCEIYQEALKESDLLNNFVTLAKNVMQTDKMLPMSATGILVLCRCLERCFLTQRISILVIEQVIRICSYYLKTCKSTTYSLPVLRLFLTSCYLSIANSLQGNSISGAFESVFYNGPSNSNGENMLVMLERVNVFWKRLTDPDVIDVIESRILSRLISSIMTEFMSGEEVLNKTIHQLLRSWPKAQYIAKTLFDIITRCFNQPEGEKLIRKWTLMVLPSLTSSRPVNLSVWVTTIVLVASGSSSRINLRAIFSQCLEWLTHFEIGDENITEMETCLFVSSFAFINDMSRDPKTEVENKAAFFKAIHSNLNIPSFQKLYTLCLKKKLV